MNTHFWWNTICRKIKFIYSIHTSYKQWMKGKAPGGTQFFFGGCVPHRFPKVWSRERIFLENEESWEQKFVSWELKFWPKQGWKCKICLKIENGGHMSGALTVNWYARERRLAWKRWLWPWHIPVPLSNLSATPPFELKKKNYCKMTKSGSILIYIVCNLCIARLLQCVWL